MNYDYNRAGCKCSALHCQCVMGIGFAERASILSRRGNAYMPESVWTASRIGIPYRDRHMGGHSATVVEMFDHVKSPDAMANANRF